MKTKNLIGTAALACAFAVVAFAGDPNQKFIMEAYEDLLGRAPAPTEVTTFEMFLNAGATRSQVAGVITSSLEYRRRLVQGFYQMFLHRAADDLGLNALIGLLAMGATDDQVKSQILGSAEYFRLAGGTNEGFINQLFNDLLNRPADPGAQMFLKLLGMESRAQVALIVLTSLEYDQRTVEGFYKQFLNRMADSHGLNLYVDLLQHGMTDEVVIDLIIGSNEYFARAQHTRMK
jgi:Domain of unknown function (DUF4214)